MTPRLDSLLNKIVDSRAYSWVAHCHDDVDNKEQAHCSCSVYGQPCKHLFVSLFANYEILFKYIIMKYAVELSILPFHLHINNCWCSIFLSFYSSLYTV
jgi:hypothetical protein